VARQEIHIVGGAPGHCHPARLGAAAVRVAAVGALGALWAGVPTLTENSCHYFHWVGVGGSLPIIWTIFWLCTLVIQMVEHQAVGTA